MSWAGITVEGGFFPPDLMDAVARGDAVGQAAADFGIEGRLTDATQRAFADVRLHRDAFLRRRDTSRESLTSLTRESWMIPLLEVLGFHDLRFQRAAVPAGGDGFTISHLAGEDAGAPPVHIVGFDQALDRRDGARRSPHALVQEFLNRSDALWGITTNGSTLRLLRDSARIAHPAFVEFDLDGIVGGNRYAEFALMYRLLHRTRFPRGAEDAPSSVLEALYQEGLSVGSRVREKLSEGVEEALVALANGFLTHPDSARLRERLASGALSESALYRQLLRLVYRLLFLFVTEERRLLFPNDAAGPDRRAAFELHYGAGRLRDRCERLFGDDRYSDLWPGLIETFRVLRDEDAARAFGMSALNGELFGADACGDLEDAGCENRALLAAVFRLSTFEDAGEPARGRRRAVAARRVRRRVNYAGLDVEELGSVYEGLLELQPAVDLAADPPFRFVSGGERKATGSYYTPSSLVQELIESALVPVLQDRLRAAKTAEERERAILSMAVCDPAAGSGHFLLAAARRMGRELAKVRTGEAEPAPADYRRAHRDVIRSCIYAVDRNPLAVDLCKVALWIEGHASGLPLSFLDHHVKVGNSLVGLLDLAALEDGIPDDAYKPVAGDDRAVASAVKRANKAFRDRGQLQLGVTREAAEPMAGLAGELTLLAELPEQTVDDVQAKAELYAALHDSESAWATYQTACNLWTAAFFTPLVQDFESTRPSLAPMTEDVWRALNQHEDLDDRVVTRATLLADRESFFHWPLEFPEIAARGGFDCILGNPPWDLVKVEDKEFFAGRAPKIASAGNSSLRKRMISTLEHSEDTALRELYRDYVDSLRIADSVGVFFRESGRFPLSGRGGINLYAVFAETMMNLVAARGSVGTILPAGIATDAGTRFLFQSITDSGRLVSIFGFENEDRIFTSVHNNTKFCLITIGGIERTATSADVLFFARKPEQIRDEWRHYRMSAEDYRLLRPNTLNSPSFRSSADAELVKGVYKRLPVLVDEVQQINPWKVSFFRMFDMSGDSALFRSRSELELSGCQLRNNTFYCENARWLPLYEGKMISQYDHRFGTYDGQTQAQSNKGVLPHLTDDQHKDPNLLPLPLYWLPEDVVQQRRSSAHLGHWDIAFRDVTNPTLTRSGMFAVLPAVAVGHKTPILVPQVDARTKAVLLAILNSFCVDYLIRQNLGGASLSFFILRQIAVPAPRAISDELAVELSSRVLELVYTAHDLVEFSMDLGFTGKPFRWDTARRELLRAEIDGMVAHVYGLSREEFDHVLSSFSSGNGLMQQEIARFGEFRTKRMCLESYDQFAQRFKADSPRSDLALRVSDALQTV